MTDRATEAARGPTRLLQIHVTRRCNLACLHCYSASGPDAREALDPGHLMEAVDDAAALGYTLVSLSGGEPFLYPHMTPLLARVKRAGMGAAVVTNGMFLDARRLEPLAEVLDFAAVSLDGAPARHNRMRANPRAFETMAAKLPALRASGVPFGFLFTLSRENAHELDWAADFALEAGARSLQVHPLDEVGRAAETPELRGARPDVDVAIDAAQRAAAAQRRLGGRLRIVVDYQPRMEVCAPPPGSCGRTPRFADIANPLCIETDGTVTPMGHGFARDFALGELGRDRLVDMAEDWRLSGRADRYAGLVARAQAAANAPDAPLIANMAQAIRRASHAPAG